MLQLCKSTKFSQFRFSEKPNVNLKQNIVRTKTCNKNVCETGCVDKNKKLG